MRISLPHQHLPSLSVDAILKLVLDHCKIHFLHEFNCVERTSQVPAGVLFGGVTKTQPSEKVIVLHKGCTLSGSIPEKVSVRITIEKSNGDQRIYTACIYRNKSHPERNAPPIMTVWFHLRKVLVYYRWNRKK